MKILFALSKYDLELSDIAFVLTEVKGKVAPTPDELQTFLSA